MSATGSKDELLRCLQGRHRFLVDVRFDPSRLGPKTIQIEGLRYHRFMDYVYLPKPPQELAPEEVVALCDLRIEIFDRVVDKSLNRRIVACMAEGVRQEVGDALPVITKVLDFGCGTGLASTLFREMWRLPCETIGVDLSLRAVELACASGLEARLVHTGDLLPFTTATFDVVIACFVLHRRDQSR